MAKFYKNTENTDGEETVFFQAAKEGKSTDQYDTQQLSAEQIRRRAAQQYESPIDPQTGEPINDVYYGQVGGYTQNGYAQNGYPQNGAHGQGNGYAQNGYSQNGAYGQSNGYAQNGYPQNGAYGQTGGYAHGNGYAQNGRNDRTQSDAGASRTLQQRSASAQRTAQLRSNSGTSPHMAQSRQSAPSQPRQRTSKALRRTSYEEPSTRRQSREPKARTQGRNRQKKSLLYRLVRMLCLLIILLFLLYSVVALVGILSMNHVDTGSRSVTTGSLSESYVKNVLVIGNDSRDPETDAGRSDSMILVSINSKTNNVYMTSLMRDAYVEIPGNGSGKLNAAYSYGGAELLMDTIEYNYDVRIDDYVMLTFEACVDAIDAVGGVELTISDEEAEAINEILISEVNEIMGDDREDDLLSGGGTLELDGKQALSYSRIRYVGNADFERTERQRVVMQQVMERALGNPLRLAVVCARALPDLTTNMSVLSLYRYAVVAPVQLLFYDTQQQRIPADGTYSNATIGGESVLEVDFSAAQQLLEQTVFAAR